MKTKSLLPILSILIFLFSFHCSFARHSKNSRDAKYLPYSTMVAKYFENYTEPPDVNPVLRFAKKPDGWHAVIYDAYKQIVIKDELFWSRAKKKFLKIDFPPKTIMPDGDMLNKYLDKSSYDYNNITKEPYYGYVGWEWDVIHDYSNYQNFSDTLLEALARAMSSYTEDLLNNNTGYADSSKMFKLGDGMNALSNAQLDTFIYYRHLCSEVYATLYKRNPKYATFIGGISYDYSNSFVSNYLDLCVYQNREIATKELHPGLYDSTSIAFAENYLSSCAQGAVLFTNGDNDTYPLMYVRDELGFRPDVSIVNTSLLNTCRYIDYISETNPGLFSFTHDKYKEGVRDYVYIVPDSALCPTNKYFDLKQLMDFVASDDKSTKYPTAFGDVPYMPTRNFKLPVDRQFVLNNGTVTAKYIATIDTALTWKLHKTGVEKAEMMLLDLLVNNHWKRPVYFSSSSSPSTFLGLNDHLQMEGLAYRIVPAHAINKDSGSTGFVNTDVMYDHMMNKFKWGNVSDTNVFINEALSNMAKSHKICFTRLADALTAEGKRDSALKVLDKCQSVFPEKNVAYEYYEVLIGRSCYRAGDFAKGNKIMNRLIDIYAKEIEKYHTQNRQKDEAIKSQLQTSQAIMQFIMVEAGKFDQQTIADKAKKIFQKYPVE